MMSRSMATLLVFLCCGLITQTMQGADKKNVVMKEVSIESIEGKHEYIYKGLPDVQNTGFFIAGKLFYPGDSFHNPQKKIDILALPVAGPWCGDTRAGAWSCRRKVGSQGHA